MLVEGIVPALLTPFRSRLGPVDLTALAGHVDWLHARGVRCVSPLGTTGEGQSLGLEERKAVIRALEAHGSGMRFIPGTGCTSLPETIELSRFAVDHGALAVLVAPPSYYRPDGPGGLLDFYSAVLDALPDEGRLLVYHIERQTQVPIPDELVSELVARYGAKVSGMKDSSGDLAHVTGWLRDFPELTVFCGADVLAAEFAAAGGRAMITAGANVHPAELASILRGEDVEASQAFVTAVRDLTAGVPRQAALKLLLHTVSGLPRSPVRPPLTELDAAQAARLVTDFEELTSRDHR